MRKVNIAGYWAFGYNYYLLRFRSKDRPLRKGTESLSSLLNDLFDMLDHLDLRVTRAAAGDLDKIRTRVKSGGDNAMVDAALAKEVSSACHKLHETLQAELGLRTVFMVTPKRLPLETLLESPAKIFATNIFHQLPSISKFDFASACLCIAFDLPTAAGFHAMRGVEGVLRHYYCSVVKRGRPRKLLWGPMVEHLRKRSDAPPKPLLDSLDNIRENCRNPTQHPDARYDMDEAQDLLAVSGDATNRMIKDIAARARAKKGAKKGAK